MSLSAGFSRHLLGPLLQIPHDDNCSSVAYFFFFFLKRFYLNDLIFNSLLYNLDIDLHVLNSWKSQIVGMITIFRTQFLNIDIKVNFSLTGSLKMLMKRGSNARNSEEWKTILFDLSKILQGNILPISVINTKKRK